MGIWAWLQGKKTIITAIITVITAFGALLADTITLLDFIGVVLAAITIIFGAQKGNRIEKKLNELPK